MKESIGAIAEPLLVLSLVALVVLIFVTILKALRGSSFFTGKTAVVVAVCATLLSVIGIYEFLMAPERPQRPIRSENNTDQNSGSRWTLLLLPYAALSIAILLGLLLLWARGSIQYMKQKRLKKTADRRSARMASHDEQVNQERRFR